MEGSSLFTSAQLPSEPPKDPLPGPQRKPRKRLGGSGAAILEAYWSTYPNPLEQLPVSDKKELTTKIKALPGYDYWSEKNTADWFKRRKKKLEQRDAAIPSKLVSPSKDALQHLGVLLKNQPNPSSAVIKTWASLFARDRGSLAVENWIGYITQVVQASNRSSDCPLPPSTNLPTPAGTVTPEPLMQASGSSSQSLPLTEMKPDSPILGTLAARTQPTATSSPSAATAEIGSPVSRHLGDEKIQLPATSLHAILADALQASQHPRDRIRPLPSDADEFVTMFAPYEAKLTRLLHILESNP